MSSVNKVILIGNLGQDPEVRETQNSHVCNLSIATNDRVKRDGDWVDEVQWHRVVVWGTQAENCGKYLEKGRSVYVEGRLTTRKWTDRDGQDRWTTEIVAADVRFLGGGGGGQGQGQGQGRGDRRSDRRDDRRDDRRSDRRSDRRDDRRGGRRRDEDRGF